MRRFDALVEWLPFDLHPEYPPEGLRRQVLLDRYGPRFADGVRAMFAEAGLAYAPHPELVPRSRLALELGEQARVEDVHPAFHAAAMEAYWSDGRDLGDAVVLRNLAARSGISAAGTEAALVERAHRQAVDASTLRAQQLGVTGVPAFVIDDRVLVLGAQSHETLAAAVEQARAS